MLQYEWIRTFFGDNGTLSDKSLPLQDEDNSTTIPIVAAEDFLYVGQYFPFNNIYLSMSTANTAASAVTVEYWTGAWTAAVDVLDSTALAGASLGQSGSIQFEPDKALPWQVIDDTATNTAATELNTVTVYDLYWMRLSFSADLDLATASNILGYKFSQTQMLVAIDPEINQYLTSWEAGKTDWEEQIRYASLHLIQDLKLRGLIIHPGQILRFSDISLATAYRSLQLIYTKLGAGFEVQAQNAKEQYEKLINVDTFLIDQNRNASVDSEDLVTAFTHIFVPRR